MSLKQECIDMFSLIFKGLPEYEDLEIEESTGVFLCPNENYKATDDLYYDCYETCSMKDNCKKEFVKIDLAVFIPWWAGDEDGGSIYINFNKKPLREQYKQTIHYINNRKQLIELMHELKQRAEDMRNAYAEYAKKIIKLRKYGQEFLAKLQQDYPVFADIKTDLPIVFSDFSEDENGNYAYDIGGDFKIMDVQLIIHIYDCWRDLEQLKTAVRHEILHYVLFRIGVNHSDDSAYFHYFCNKYDAHAYKEMSKEQQDLYEALLEAKVMEAYEGWADKAAECATKIEELKTQVRELELQKFNNIIEDFTNQFDLFGDSIDLIKGQIGLLEEAGQLVGSNYYTKQIEQSQKQLNLLEEEKATLVKQMTEAINSGRIQRGTSEWLEMANSIIQVENEILDVKTSIEELDNELLDLNWQIFERVQTEIGNINEELGNLVGLFDDFNDIKVSDGKGTWTNEAIATLGLYAQQYEASKQQVQDYSDAIAQLEADYKAGKYSTIEYLDKLASLKEGMWQAVDTAESMEDAIISLNETRVNEEIETIEKEIDSYKELIDAQIEAIEETENLRKKQEELSEKSKTVADIEKQLAAMQNDNTAATVAKRKLLEEELAEAKKDLADTENDYLVESQKTALESQLEDYENARNAEIEALEESLNDRETLIAQSFETVKQNADVVGQEIALIAQEHGVVVSDAIITSWANGETAIASYGTVLSAESSAFIANIMGVENEVYALQSQADTASVAISNMFGQRADNLVSQLVSSYTAEDNLNNATNILQNSLINTLERGYNISSTTSALDSIASSANGVTSAATAAANALADLMKAQVAQSTTIQKPTVIKTNTTGYTGASSNTINAGHKYLVSAKAKGGIISKDDDGVLDPIAKALGEDTMFAAKYGESVLSKEQTKILQEFSEALENGTSMQYLGLENTWSKNTAVPRYVVNNDIPEMEKVTTNNNVTVRYDKMYEIHGDIYDAYQFEKRVSNISNKQTTKMLNDINTHFRITGR